VLSMWSVPRLYKRDEGSHSSIFILMTFLQLKMILTAISVYGDDTNLSFRSGSIDIAVRKLNSAIGILERWFRNEEYRLI
jgi:hypothetical protein